MVSEAPQESDDDLDNWLGPVSRVTFDPFQVPDGLQELLTTTPESWK